MPHKVTVQTTEGEVTIQSPSSFASSIGKNYLDDQEVDLVSEKLHTASWRYTQPRVVAREALTSRGQSSSYTVRPREAAAYEAARNQEVRNQPLDLASQRDNVIAEAQLLLNSLQAASTSGTLKGRQLSLAVTKVEEALHWLKAIEV